MGAALTGGGMLEFRVVSGGELLCVSNGSSMNSRINAMMADIDKLDFP